MDKAKIIFLISLILITQFLVRGQPQNREETGLVNESGKIVRSVSAADYCRAGQLGKNLTFNPELVLKQINQVLAYYKQYSDQDRYALRTGILTGFGFSLQRVSETLKFIRNVLIEDKKKGVPSRFHNKEYIKQNFLVFHWSGGKTKTGSRIRITKYAVFIVKGVGQKQGKFSHALYQIPDDEHGLTLEQAEKNKNRLSRFRYSKQQVLNGAYDGGGAKPLIWVTRKSLEKALLQGTLAVQTKNGSLRFFNVSRSNRIGYQKGVLTEEQKRYWYFSEVNQPKGYGIDFASQVNIYPGVCFAGDVGNLMFGLPVCVSGLVPGNGEKLIFGLLADTGGAFSANLDQLDYYCGIFDSQDKFSKFISGMKEYGEVFFLLKK